MHPIQQMIIEDELELQNNSLNVKQKLELQNTIIQLKINYDKKLYNSELYLDVKRLFIYYLDTIDDRKHVYDFVNTEYIMQTLSAFEFKEKDALLEFLIRKLKLSGLEEKIPFFLQEKKVNEIRILKKDFPKDFFAFLSKLITYNIWSIFLTVMVSYLVYFLLLLPSPFGIELFDVKYQLFSKNFFLNHFCNTLLGIFGLNNDDFVNPMNITGVILIVMCRIYFILLILNICISKLTEQINSKF